MAQDDEVTPLGQEPPEDDAEVRAPARPSVPDSSTEQHPASGQTPASEVEVPAVAEAVEGGAQEDEELKTRLEETLPGDRVLPGNVASEAPGSEAADAAVLAVSRKHTRRSFAAAAAAAIAGTGVYLWIDHSSKDMEQPIALRKAFEVNAAVDRTLFDDRGLAPTYPVSRAEELRVNGNYGLKQALLPESWRLQVVGARNASQHSRFSKDVTAWKYQYATADPGEDRGHDTKVPPPSNTAEKMAPKAMIPLAASQETRAIPMPRMPRGQEEAGESKSSLASGTAGLLLTMEDLFKLPRHELVTQFKCIEGWSQIVHWAGFRMADFLELYPPELIDGKEPEYVYMETPNGDYYTGYDMHIMRHPQTLLVTEMMGAPLTQNHGAPLRLHMPTKYGYKQIKRIGLISYTNDKPDDYWTKLGYDWFAGL